MRLYARMKKYYGMAHAEMDAMHFVTFFGYVREAQLMVDEEKAEYDRARRGGENVAQTAEQAETALSGIPQAQTYEGETLAL